MKLRVGRFVEYTLAEGPGARAALWVQGCSIRCLGCVNPQFFSGHGGQTVEVADILERIRHGPPIEGITLLGGEPFEQASALADLARRIRSLDGSVMTFTGHLYENLVASDESGVQELLNATDLLVDGPYLRDHLDQVRPWVGSTNQRFIALTSRYAHLVHELSNFADTLEIHFRPDGTIGVSGMPHNELLRVLSHDVGLRLHQR